MHHQNPLKSYLSKKRFLKSSVTTLHKNGHRRCSTYLVVVHSTPGVNTTSQGQCSVIHSQGLCGFLRLSRPLTAHLSCCGRRRVLFALGLGKLVRGPLKKPWEQFLSEVPHSVFKRIRLCVPLFCCRRVLDLPSPFYPAAAQHAEATQPAQTAGHEPCHDGDVA